MSALIRAELLKIRTTRTGWWLIATMLGLTALTVWLSIWSFGEPGVILGPDQEVVTLLSSAHTPWLLMVVLGVLVAAGEFRHHTATATFLVTPRRERVIAAKLGAVAVIGLAVTAAATAITLAIALPWLAVQGEQVSLLRGANLTLLGGAAASIILWGFIGVGLGALFRSQLAGILALIGMVVIEVTLETFVPSVERWLPFSADHALTVASTSQLGGLLPMWGGALLLAGYGLAFAAGGTALMLRRTSHDIHIVGGPAPADPVDGEGHRTQSLTHDSSRIDTSAKLSGVPS